MRSILAVGQSRYSALPRKRHRGLLTDPSLGDTDDAEFQMEVNGLLAESLIGLNGDGRYGWLVDTIVTYFSAIGEILEERLWDGENWKFTERYVPYLRELAGRFS